MSWREQCHMEHNTVSNNCLEMAFRVAARYASRLPTVSELMADFGMSRATAYRWLRALRNARGVYVGRGEG